MTDRADYTSEEWNLLKETPFVVGAAVAVAGASGLGTASELFAVITGTTGGMLAFPENELIQALLKEEENRPSPFKNMDRAELMPAAIDRCHQVVAVLEAKTPAVEAAGYKRWVVTVGEAVAEAAKEGGFMGFGGERLSQEERLLLDEIKAALKIEAEPTG